MPSSLIFEPHIHTMLRQHNERKFLGCDCGHDDSGPSHRSHVIRFYNIDDGFFFDRTISFTPVPVVRITVSALTVDSLRGHQGDIALHLL